MVSAPEVDVSRVPNEYGIVQSNDVSRGIVRNRGVIDAELCDLAIRVTDPSLPTPRYCDVVGTPGQISLVSFRLDVGIVRQLQAHGVVVTDREELSTALPVRIGPFDTAEANDPVMVAMLHAAEFAEFLMSVVFTRTHRQFGLF